MKGRGKFLSSKKPNVAKFSPFEDDFSKIKFRKGAKVAITAAARMMRVIYLMHRSFRPDG